MDAAKFIALLKSPDKLGDVSTGDLKALVQQYPYAAIPRMLLLKKLQNTSPDEFTASLPSTAILSPNRTQLKSWVEQLVTAKPTEPVAEAKPVEPPVVVQKETPVEPIVAPVVEIQKEQPVEPVVEPPIEVEKEVATKPAVEQYDLPEPEEVRSMGLVPPAINEAVLHAVAELNKQQTEPKEVAPVVEETIEEESVAAEPTIEETVTEAPAVVEETITETPTVVETPVEETIKDEPTVIEETKEKEPVAVEPIAETPVEETTEAPAFKAPSELSFSDWLQYVTNNKLPEVAAEPTIVEELNVQFQAAQYEAELSREIDDTPIPDISALMPKRIKQKAETQSFESLAEKSATLNEESVTETLAKIYVIQKKADKAIEAYGILKKRFPDKAAEYDAAIKKIQQG